MNLGCKIEYGDGGYLSKCWCGWSAITRSQIDAAITLGQHHADHPPVTDDQLRAECERRGIDVGTLRRAIAKADEDRDEWKRRAKAAEAKAAQFDELRSVRDFYRVMADQDRLDAEAIASAINAPLTPEQQARVERIREAGAIRVGESGPGIAAKPVDDGHWLLDVDLLCEDE